MDDMPATPSTPYDDQKPTGRKREPTITETMDRVEAVAREWVAARAHLEWVAKTIAGGPPRGTGPERCEKRLRRGAECLHRAKVHLPKLGEAFADVHNGLALWAGDLVAKVELWAIPPDKELEAKLSEPTHPAPKVHVPGEDEEGNPPPEVLTP